MMNSSNMLELRRYTPDCAAEWNQFVQESKNGTFLFNRNYMDYHADRFEDHSFMVYHNGKLFCMLPANRCGDTLYSHQGLTYGGFVTSHMTTTVHLMETLRLLNEHLTAEGIRRVVYKVVPNIYHIMPAEEDLYAIHRECRYRLLERDLSTTIALRDMAPWKKDRRHALKKATQHGLTLRQSDNYEEFWPLLSENLHTRHNVSPVHSLEEICLLRNRFPRNILLFTAHQDSTLLAGCVVYLTKQTVHAQYMSASSEGRRLGALDFIVHHLVTDIFSNYRYFDFGKSTEQHSDMLNQKLLYQKEGFGGRAICYDTYEWETCS